MIRILIIGDSWARGEFSFDQDKGHYVSHPGIEEYLISEGLVIKNLSCPGDSNMRQLRLCYEELLKKPYDTILWFQTEPLRNIYQFTPFPDSRDMWSYDSSQIKNKSYDKILEEWFSWTYGKAQDIFDRFRIPFTIIGGMVPLHPLIKNYNFYNNLIWSWAEELVGIKPPYNSFYHTGCFINDNIKHLDPKRMSEELAACRYYEDQQELCSQFQYRHPDRQAHKMLSERLLTMWHLK